LKLVSERRFQRQCGLQLTIEPDQGVFQILLQGGSIGRVTRAHDIADQGEIRTVFRLTSQLHQASENS
jgi:hypothetical protein